MPKQDYDLQRNDQQNINAKTWQDSDVSHSDSDNVVQTNKNQDYTENIPTMTAEEQAALNEKRNSPEFQQGLQNMLPKTDKSDSDQTNKKKPDNLNALIQQWQKDTPNVGIEEVNPTNIPNKIKASIENRSGISLDDVQVHYNSNKPEEVNALAYTQGNDIHLGPGQEQHLAHELAHIVQQREGRVKATTQINGMPVNDNKSLESEADSMGDKALKDSPKDKTTDKPKDNTQQGSNVIQRKAKIQGTDMTLKDINESNQPEQIKAVMRGWIEDGSTENRNFDDLVHAIKAAQDQLVDTSYNGTLSSVAALLTGGLSGAGLLSDELLLRILTGPFEGNWFKAKACLTMDNWPAAALGGRPAPPHENSINLMEALVEMRGRVWDTFAKATVPKIKDAVAAKKAADMPGLENPAEQDKNLKIGEAVGSNSVTSDIDLSLQGENTEIGVALINSEFRNYFGVPYDPGTVFDINVYSSDWMFGGTEVKGADNVATYNPNAEATPSNELEQQERSDINEVWSMVKIRRNMDSAQWDTYKANTLAALGNVPDQVASTTALFAKTEQEYTAFRTEVHDRVDAMSQELDDGEAALLGGQASVFGGHYDEEARETRASNAIYEETILQVKALRLQLKALRGANASPAELDATSKELAHKIAKALTFANEVYASEGAVLHTVYGKQGAAKKMGKLNDMSNEKETSKFVKKGEVTAVKYNLKPEHYLQSVNENVGDTLHSLNHFADTPEYAAYRAGKYIDRLCEAVTLLLGEEEARQVANFADLLEIGAKSVQEKSGKAGEDPMAVKAPTSFFSKFNDASKINEIKAKAIAMGANAAGKHKSKTKRLKADE